MCSCDPMLQEVSASERARRAAESERDELQDEISSANTKA